jgi:hypothetical protein
MSRIYTCSIWVRNMDPHSEGKTDVGDMSKLVEIYDTGRCEFTREWVYVFRNDCKF